ncbi:SDR family oxidoreductase [bacterium]|nr:SDR family oxidoreductase [bacterium]
MPPRPVAVVTNASRGMGAACARELARRGHDLALMARGDDLRALADGLGAIAVTGSVTSEDDLRQLVDAALARYGRLEAVVNNTGHAPKGNLLGLTDADWPGFDLLYPNVVRVTRLATPALFAWGGAIVNISSFEAVEPSLQFPVSSAMRAALGAFAKLYSQKYAGAGVRMNNVLPGFIDTDPAGDATVAAIPAGRAGAADEVAKVVRFLASAESSYVIGQSLLVDGELVRGV